MLVVGLELGERLEYGKGRAAAVVGLVEGFHSAGEGHGTRYGGDVLGTQLFKLGGKHLLQPEHGFGYHFKFRGSAFVLYRFVAFFDYYHGLRSLFSNNYFFPNLSIKRLESTMYLICTASPILATSS